MASSSSSKHQWRRIKFFTDAASLSNDWTPWTSPTQWKFLQSPRPNIAASRFIKVLGEKLVSCSLGDSKTPSFSLYSVAPTYQAFDDRNQSITIPQDMTLHNHKFQVVYAEVGSGTFPNWEGERVQSAVYLLPRGDSSDENLWDGSENVQPSVVHGGMYWGGRDGDDKTRLYLEEDAMKRTGSDGTEQVVLSSPTGQVYLPLKHTDNTAMFTPADILTSTNTVRSVIVQGIGPETDRNGLQKVTLHLCCNEGDWDGIKGEVTSAFDNSENTRVFRSEEDMLSMRAEEADSDAETDTDMPDAEEK